MTKRIAIIGGGFSGIAVAYNLLKLSGKNKSILIDIFDNKNFKNNGKAYQTTDISHILNVPADKMGLPFDDEKHFYHWLSINLKISRDSFVPRALYHLYLQEIISDLRKNSNLNFINEKVKDIEFANDSYILHTQNQQDRYYDDVVLACGLGIKKIDTRKISDKQNSQKIINDIWQFFNQSQLPKVQTILIVGSGLTMVDAVLSLKNKGFFGKIIACSRNAKLPLPHSKIRVHPITVLEKPDALLPLSKILQKLKKAAQKIKEESDSKELKQGWQSIMDGLRPITSEFWQQFSLQKKQQFIRHLMVFWNIHRHRMAIGNHNKMIEMVENKELQMIKGRLVDIKEENQKLLVTLSNKQIVEVDLVLNAMGFDFVGSGSSLLVNLLREKIIINHLTNLGFVVAKNQSHFHLAGALLTGDLLEITAVPDLRNLAHNISKKILQQN